MKKIYAYVMLFLLLSVSAFIYLRNTPATNMTDCTISEIKSGDYLLYRTSDVYLLLSNLDKKGCISVGDAEFDDIIMTQDLNIMSYILIGKRTKKGVSNELGLDEMIQSYVKDYISAKGTVDMDLLLFLSDIYAYSCGVSEECLGEKFRVILDGLNVSEEAKCFYGMNGICKFSDPTSFAFLNTATIENSVSILRKNRADFICDRYHVCDLTEGRQDG